MQEKESVNFFYYLNPMQIKKNKKKAGLKQKKTESQGEITNKIKQIA